MADILDMNEYRAKLRAQRRFKRDLEETSSHPALEHHPTWVPGDEQSRWAYGPEGLSGGPATEPQAEPKPVAEIVQDFYGKDNVAVTRLGPAKARTEDYLDRIIDEAYKGSQWAAFRLALLQLRDEAPGLARETMQLSFPDMLPAKFEIWLDRATEEFDEYSDSLEREFDQP